MVSNWTVVSLYIVGVVVGLYAFGYFVSPYESVLVENGSVFYSSRFRGDSNLTFSVNVSDLNISCNSSRYAFFADGIPLYRSGGESELSYGWSFDVDCSSGTVSFVLFPVHVDALERDMFLCRRLNIVIYPVGV